MNRYAARYWPLATSLLVYALFCLWLNSESLALGAGMFIYPTDDSYIHLALAKHLAQQGIWSVTGIGFTPASSSALWTLLTAGLFKLLGFHLRLPLLLNVLFGAVLLAWADWLLRRAGRGPLLRLGTSLAILVFAPLVPVVFVGMEHVLHALLAVLFVFAAARYLDDIRPSPERQGRFLLLPLLALLLVAVRYEGLAMTTVFAALLWLKRERGAALLILVSSLIPVVVYALFANVHGAPPLPNTAYLKGLADFPPGVTPNASEYLFWKWVQPLRMNALLGLGIVLAVAVMLRRIRRYGTPWHRTVALALLFAVPAAGHLVLSEYNNFYRHELYLYVLLFLFVVEAAWEDLGEWWKTLRGYLAGWPGVVAFLLLLYVAYPFAHDALRRAWALKNTPTAMRNIYQQQMQTARFFREEFAGQTVAIHDLGAVALFGKVEIVDLWGLASSEVMRLKQRGEFNPDTMERICRERGVVVAVIYDGWRMKSGGTPESWTKLATWTIPYNYVCAFPDVSVYATDPEQVARVRRALFEFSRKLPQAVRQEGAYLTAD